MIKRLKEKSPSIHPAAFIAARAVVAGDVTIGARSSVWFNAVARGDVNYIKIGADTNAQDSSMLHVTADTHPLEIGDRVTIGHGAIVHGCVIERAVLVGMGAIVLDGARLCENSMVAAGALVPPGFVLPSGKLAVGVPAKAARDLSEDEIEMIKNSAERYVKNSRLYMENGFAEENSERRRK